MYALVRNRVCSSRIHHNSHGESFHQQAAPVLHERSVKAAECEAIAIKATCGTMLLFVR